jgi:hypothetical protein
LSPLSAFWSRILVWWRSAKRAAGTTGWSDVTTAIDSKKKKDFKSLRAFEKHCAHANPVSHEPHLRQSTTVWLTFLIPNPSVSFPVGKTSMWRAFTVSILLLVLTSAASAAVLSLYSAFDPRHPANSGYHWLKERHAPMVTDTSDTTGSVPLACGRGRYRDPTTHQCRGPADLR